MTDSIRSQDSLDWRYVLYNALLLLLSPLAALYILWRMVVKGKSRQGLAERLGFVPPQARELAHHQDPVVWFQACSVGEVAAVEPIINAFRQLEPLAHVVLSTTTPTGREMALKRGLELDALIYWPFDAGFIVGRVLEAIKPDMLVTVDTELWPNILAVARHRGVRLAVVNGRISDRAYPKDRAIRPVLAWTLSQVDAVLAQSQKDADRFAALGAPTDRISVLGNAKLDEELPAVSEAEADRLRYELGLPADAPVFVAGSTREGEEEKVLDAYETLRHEHRDLQLVLAPRHPERGDAIEKLVGERGFAAHRRSRALAGEENHNPQPAGGQVRVVILDTIGELTKVYALATVAFVGGSLVPWGGHNILQPIAQGKPTLMGPWMHNQQDIADIALSERAAVTVRDPDELAQVAGSALGSEAERQLFATRGQAMLSKHGGASARYAQELAKLLHSGPQGMDQRF